MSKKVYSIALGLLAVKSRHMLYIITWSLLGKLNLTSFSEAQGKPITFYLLAMSMSSQLFAAAAEQESLSLL